MALATGAVKLLYPAAPIMGLRQVSGLAWSSEKKFKELVEIIGPELPGWTKESRRKQKAAGGDPIAVEL